MLAILPVFLLLMACSSNGRHVLGDGMTLKPGWDRFKQSAIQAMQDPAVWIPLAGAVLLQVDDLDHELSDRLREDTPVFGSADKAAEASDDFRSLTTWSYLGTALMTSTATDHSWFVSKAKLLGAEWVTVQAARGVTGQLKSLSQRERPNGLNDKSFPSGHATSASVQAQMAKLNIAYLPLSKGSQTALNWTQDGFAVLTAWARVEAGMHYPADVLAGWAVGRFVGHLGTTFITANEMQARVSPLLSQTWRGIEVEVRF